MLRGRVDIRHPVTVEPVDYRCDPVGFPLHGPSAIYRHLRQDPQVHASYPDDLRRFLHGVVYLVRTGIP